jgi:hypothetical protein
LGKACSSFQKCHFRQFFSLKFLLESAIFAIFRQQQSAIFAAFRSAKKGAVFREKQARPNSQPKLDHFSPHFAPRKVQFFAIFRFAKKSADFRRISLRGKKYHFFREKNREQQARPI